MKIAIDSRWIFKKISGVGKYTETLILALAKLDSENDYLLIFDDEQVSQRMMGQLKDKSNFKSLQVPYGIFSIQNQLRLPFVLAKLGVDIFHSSNFMMPLFWMFSTSYIKKIITIHDIILIHSPAFSPKSIKSKFYLIYKWVTQWIVAKADMIFTDSDHSKKDMLHYLNVSKEKIKIIYMGVDEKFLACRDAGNKEQLKERYGFKNNHVVIYVGRQDPYKNVTGLVEAFALLVKNKANAKLVVIGEKDDRYPEAFKKAKQLNIESHICFSGYIDDETLYDYFKMADLLVLPSRYEGFGLPVIEAMAAGIPVVCSNCASLPEVVGDAALLVDPDDIGLLAKYMEKILADEQKRGDLIQRGYKRVEGFTAIKMAEAVLNEYKRGVS